MANLAMNLLDASGQFADRPAVKLDDSILTYAELDDLSARVAGRLRAQSIAPGDHVGIMLPNVAAFPVLYYGVLRAGAVVVPMNPLLKSREVEHYLRDSGAGLVFAWETSASEAAAAAQTVGAETVVISADSLEEIAGWPLGAEVCARDDSDTAVLLYTSGTTGTPKGAQLTHANMRANASASAIQLFEMTADDVVMGCLPLFHAFGQTCGMNASILVGATLTLLPRFDPAMAFHVIERDHVTVFEGVPTMYVALLHAEDRTADISSLRCCVSGGSALPEEILRRFAAEFGVNVLEGYGLSETSPVASFNLPGRAKPGSVGVPIEGVEMRLVDGEGNVVPDGEIGEIAIRGHNVMSGYRNRPEATAEAIQDGWFHTGDIARRDEEGFYFIVDRKKEVIIRGGFNVYPREIESVLYEHPDIVEAAVIGIPHPTHGEEVVAAVVVKRGVTCTPDDVRAFVKDRVAPYKYPRQVWFISELPKGATGKVQKRDIVVPEEAP